MIQRILFTCFVAYVIIVLAMVGVVAVNVFDGPCSQVIQEGESKNIFVKSGNTNLDYIAGIGVAGVATAFIFGMINNAINNWGQILSGSGTGIMKSLQRVVQCLFFALTVASPVMMLAVAQPAKEKAQKKVDSLKKGGKDEGGGELRLAQKNLMFLQAASTGALMFAVGLVVYVAFFVPMDCALSTIGFVPLGLYAIMGSIVSAVMVFYSCRYFFLNRQCLDQVLQRDEYKALRDASAWTGEGLFSLWGKQPALVRQQTIQNKEFSKIPSLVQITHSAAVADIWASVSAGVSIVVMVASLIGLIASILAFTPVGAPIMEIAWSEFPPML